MKKMACITAIVAWVALLAACQSSESLAPAPQYWSGLQYWTDAPHREPGNIARNKYRHPVETLQFFEVNHDLVVGEIWPSRGWYTEVLAPWLREEGSLYAIGFSTKAPGTPEWQRKMVESLGEKFAAHPQIYDRVIVTGMAFPGEEEIAPGESLDRVLTFRNVHNWMKGGYAQQVFESMFAALKPGGILGVVEHRARPGTSVEEMIKSGYVTEAHVIVLAEAAGFEFVGGSEVNANPLDTTDHVKGVWTLPPSLRDGPQEQYLAIGESDRMTLKFRKPG